MEAAAVELEQTVVCGVLLNLLPRVGEAVRTVELGGMSSIGNAQIRGIMKLCPNVS